MFCPHCRATLPEGSLFCAQCGQRIIAVQPVQPTPVPAVKKPAGNLFRILLGVLYLLPMLLYIYIPTIYNLMSIAARNQLYAYGEISIAAFSIMQSVCNIIDQALLLPVVLISAIAGVALLMNRRGPGRIAILGGVFHCITALGMLLMTVLYPILPQFTFGLYTSVPDVLENGAGQLFSHGIVAMRYVIYGLPVALISLTVAVLSFVYAHIFKKNDLPRKMDRGVAALAIATPFAVLLPNFTTIALNLVFGTFGDDYLTAYSFAHNITAQLPVSPILLLVILTVLCMVSSKWPYWLQTVPFVPVLLIGGTAAGLVLPKTAPMVGYIPESILELTVSFARTMIFEGMLLAVAYTLWAAASARGAVPAWLQPLVCVPVCFLYYTMILLTATQIRIPLTVLPAITVLVALLIASIIAVVVQAVRKKNARRAG